MLLASDRFFSQPQYAAPINRANPLCRDIQAVFNGAVGFVDLATGKPWTTVGLTFTPTSQGRAAVCDQVTANASRSQAIPPNAPGWTIAVAFTPVSYSTDHAIVGFCQAPKSSTYDRAIASGTGVPQGYLYDGAIKKVTANGPALAAGVPEIIVVTATTSVMTIYRKGFAEASLGVSNSGYTGYTTPTFCVGAANHVPGQSNVSLALLLNRPWIASEVQSWIDNPWQIFQSPPIDIWAPAAAGSSLDITGTLGTATTDGFTASVDRQLSIAGSLGTASADGFIANVDRQLAIVGSLGTATATGFTANIDRQLAILGAIGTATAGGFDATIQLGGALNISGALGTTAADGFNANIDQQIAIAASLGQSVADGFDAAVSNSSTTLTAADLAAIDALITAQLPNIAAAVLAAYVEGTTTVQQALRLYDAVLGGKVSGAGTGTETFRDLADTKDRIVATVDSNGNRTAITRDLS